MKRKNHPMQRIVYAPDGIIRFQGNKLVQMLWEYGRKTGLNLNDLAVKTRSNSDYDDDWNQLAQLLGYSITAFGLVICLMHENLL